jgi:hypothetical protein
METLEGSKYYFCAMAAVHVDNRDAEGARLDEMLNHVSLATIKKGSIKGSSVQILSIPILPQ